MIPVTIKDRSGEKTVSRDEEFGKLNEAKVGEWLREREERGIL